MHPTEFDQNLAWRNTSAALDTLFLHHPLPMFVYNKRTLAILDANNAALSLYGYPRAEFLTMTIEDLHLPEDLPALRSLVAIPAPPLRNAGEWRHRTRGGRILHMQITTHLVEVNGQPAGFVLARDVTEARHTEEMLRQSEQRFRSLAENTSDLLSRHDLNGTVLYASPALRAICGYDPEEIAGRSAFDFVHRGDLKALLAALGGLRRNGDVVTAAFRFRCRDGGFIWIESACRRTAGFASEDASEVLCVSRDITARRASEEAQRLSEERYHFVEQVTRDVIWDWDLATGDLRHNDNLSSVFGYPPEAAHTDSAWWTDRIHPEDRARIVEDMWSIIHGGGRFWTSEYRFARHDGTWASVLDRACVLRSRDGAPTRVIGARADITEHKRTEATLRFLADVSAAVSTSLEFGSTVSNLARAVVPFLADYCTVDLFQEDGSVRRIAMAHRDPDKEAALRVVQERYFSGQTTPHRILRAVRDGHAQILEDLSGHLPLLENEPELTETFRILGRHAYMGVPLTVRGQVVGALSTVVAESGRRFGVEDLVVAHEVARRASTALENATLYQDLRRANEAKEEFLATLSHELRNPLGAIISALELHRLRNPEISAPGGVLDVVDRQARQMIRLVEDLLDVSRISRRKIELHREPCPVSVLVNDALQMVEPMIRARDHQLAVLLPDQPLILDVDPARITQVIANLLRNAAKYTPAGGRITVEARREGGDMALSVRDNGDGLAPEHLTEVFDLFTQSARSLNRSDGGLGIGLSVVRSLVELHGGHVRAESDGPGLGSTFTVRLPLMEDDAVHASEGDVTDTPDAPEDRHAQRVMIVEDNVDAARTLGDILEMWGCIVQLAHDGQTALDVAADFRPDLVLLDIGLPGMDGYEVARRLRADGAMANARLVALTGYGQADDLRRSREAGFDTHLVKPVDFHLLRRLIDGVTEDG